MIESWPNFEKLKIRKIENLNWPKCVFLNFQNLANLAIWPNSENWQKCMIQY
jgi:hypothetical protein